MHSLRNLLATVLLFSTSSLFFASALSATSSTSPSPKKLVIVGGGIGGLSTAFDAQHVLRQNVEVTVVADRPVFSFTPSNPWISVGMREPSDIQLPLDKVLAKHKINFVQAKATKLLPAQNKLTLDNGESLEYDYLVAATGPRLAFEKVPGLKEHGVSVCTTPHALKALEKFEALVENPGPIVVGAVEGASCFGPAYEYALLLQHMLKKRGGKKLVDACPMTFVTSEPYLGHLGLGGAGASEDILKELFQKSHIQYVCNARLDKVTKGGVMYTEFDQDGHKKATHTIASQLTMFIPQFAGFDVWKHCPDFTDPNGNVLINEHQQSPNYKNIFGVGICVHMDPYEVTPVATGLPKTGYMIESMGTAAVHNIQAMIQANDNDIELPSTPKLNGLCITDFGSDGAIFLTLPQVPPRRVDQTIHGPIANLAKVAFEKYFLHKIESGDTDPYYEKYMLKFIGVDRTEEHHAH